MDNLKKVSDMMIPMSDYPVIYGSDSLNDAIIMLKKNFAKEKGHRSLLVFCKVQKVSGEERLIGVLTVGDILRTLKKMTNSYGVDEMMDIAMSFNAYDKDMRSKQEKIMSEGFSTKVRDSIRPMVNAFIQSEQEISDAIVLMMTNNVYVIPVFEGKKAVGILRAIDILDYIGDMLVSYTEHK